MTAENVQIIQNKGVESAVAHSWYIKNGALGWKLWKPPSWQHNAPTRGSGKFTEDFAGGNFDPANAYSPITVTDSLGCLDLPGFAFLISH